LFLAHPGTATAALKLGITMLMLSPLLTEDTLPCQS